MHGYMNFYNRLLFKAIGIRHKAGAKSFINSEIRLFGIVDLISIEVLEPCRRFWQCGIIALIKLKNKIESQDPEIEQNL